MMKWEAGREEKAAKRTQPARGNIGTGSDSASGNRKAGRPVANMTTKALKMQTLKQMADIVR